MRGSPLVFSQWVVHFTENTPIISQIPSEFLENADSKKILADMVKNMCQEPTTLAAGIIIEANGMMINYESEMIDAILSGEVKLSELKESEDIIMMLFSTPEEEEMIAYKVDVDNKKVGDIFGGKELGTLDGIFSNLFAWNKN